jgi:hypothetical protein
VSYNARQVTNGVIVIDDTIVRGADGNMTWTGADLPNYKEVIRNRGDATNNYHAVKWRLIHSYGSAYATYGDSVTTNEFSLRGTLGSLETPGPYVDSGTGDAQQRSVSQFIARARSATSPAQAGTILGEMAETIHQIRHPASSIRDAIGGYLSSVKKRTRNKPRKTKRAVVADTWLEYSFGIIPLISDTRDVAKALAKASLQIPVIKCSGTGNEESVTELPDASDSISNLVIRYRRRRKLVVTARTYGSVTMKTGGIPAFDESLGLTFQEFVPTIWNLIPYSWLVDYFFNVDDILSAATFCTSNIIFDGQSVKTSSTEECYDFQDVSVRNSFWKGSGVSAGTLGLETTVFNRTNVVTYSVPTLAFSLPGVRQFGNIAAVLAGRSRSISSTM